MPKKTYSKPEQKAAATPKKTPVPTKTFETDSGLPVVGSGVGASLEPLLPGCARVRHNREDRS